MFAHLETADMRHLSGLLANGALTAPFHDVAFLREQLPVSLRVELQSLTLAGFTSLQIATVISLIADERERSRSREARIELVATGPDGQEHARNTAVVVEQLFREAREEVFIVGFAVYDGQSIFRTIAERLEVEPALRVVVCLDVARRYGDTATDAMIVDSFRRNFKKSNWGSSRLPDLYYDPRSLSADRETRAVLHAKTIVVDEQAALVTSANPTPAAYERNIELGVVIRGGEIPRAIRRHFAALIASGSLRRIT